MRALWVPVLLVAVTLAGCADGSKATIEDDEFGDIDTKATATTGVIRGVVFDATITPIEGAKVVIRAEGKEALTSSEGAFFFEKLEPGAYFLEVSKPGYAKVQSSTNVEAGVDKPAVVKIQLDADASTRPIAELLTFDGFLQCGVGLGAADASTNPCAFTGSVNTFETAVQRPINFTQIEMVWEGTNVFGDGLSVGILRPGTLGNFVDSDGPSPRILPVTQAQMEGGMGTDYESYLIRVFPGTNQPVSVVVEQDFSIFVTNFYGIVPDEDWSFIEDGPYPIPE